MKRAIWPSSLLVSIAAVVAAQPQPGAPAFDVASVKANKSGPGPVFSLLVLPGGRVFAQNLSLRELIRAAYGVEAAQLEGGPAWIGSDRFDLEARTGPDATIETVRAMTRKLLADRFRLAVHTETRQLPVYTLVMTRSDRSLGRNLRTSGKECVAVTLPAGLPPAPPPPPGAGTPVGTGGFHCPVGLLPGHLSLRSVDMTVFASVLWRRALQEPVLDRTGLDGRFDLDLTYLPEFESINGRPANENPALPAQITGAPSIFTAIQEQLGLKLEKSRGPLDVVVIDRVESLIEN
jgi:uncharacterized protein (TIGR03435 family)